MNGKKKPNLLLGLLPGLSIWTLCACCLTTVAFAQQAERPSLIEPHVMREDFQGDGLGQWASYPPAQDVGYEPSISPTSGYDAPGGRALMRLVKPNRPGTLSLGFIKKVAMTMTGDAKFRFAYRLNSPTAGGSIEIGIAGGDGVRYTSQIKATTNKWAVAEVALDKLRGTGGRALAKDVRIDAVYLVATLSNADPDTTYRFVIDDIALSAARDANFTVRAPATLAIEPWASLVSAKGYESGETISITASSPASLDRAQCVLTTRADKKTVTDQMLYDDGTHGDERARDGVWTNTSVYTVQPGDRAGIWVARLTGRTTDGRYINTAVRFVVRSDRSARASASHPRLYFGPSDRESLVARSKNPKHAVLWESLKTAAKNARATGEVKHGGQVFEMLDTENLLPSLLGYFDVLNRARARISSNAFEAYLTGSVEARDAAKAALLDVASWKKWVPPWFEAHGQHTYYPAGLLASDAALGYDLLYEHLSAEERSLVRRAIIEKSIVPTFKEYVEDNRVMVNTSNWLSHTVGGALIAATVIADDVTEAESGGRFETYLNGLLLKLEDHIEASYLRDGSYGEGISYYEFDAETLGPVLFTLKRNFGIDYLSQSHVLDAFKYPLYTLSSPKTISLDMGDTHPPAGHGMPAFAYQSRDPLMRWYFGQFDRTSLSQFIFYDDSVASRSPREASLPTSRIFDEKGNAVFRTGWEDDDWVFLYRAGPNFNHNHADQGAFQLNAFGEPLVTEAGWSDYYKDPYYVTFFIQAAGHSTVLVDGNPESQSIADTPQFAALNRYPRITDAVTTDFHDALGSDLTPVYGDTLRRYTRRVVFVKPHYFVIYDDLATSDRASRFDWLLHLPDRARIRQSPGLAVYSGERAALAVRNLSPGETELEVRDGRIPYHVMAARTPATLPAYPAYLDWRSSSPAKSTEFLFALVPARKAPDAEALANRMTRLSGDRFVGLMAERGSERDFVMFRRGGARDVLTQGEWSADSEAWTITLDGERVKMMAAQVARSVARAGRTLFSSEAAVSFAVNYMPRTIEGVFSTTAPARIRFAISASPMRVRLNGRELTTREFAYSQSDGMISLIVPSGSSRIDITLR